MTDESVALKKYRQRWVGQLVRCTISINESILQIYGVVTGVGDDGAQAERDGRRRAKPTGMLFVKPAHQSRETDVPDFCCTCIDLITQSEK